MRVQDAKPEPLYRFPSTEYLGSKIDGIRERQECHGLRSQGYRRVQHHREVTSNGTQGTEGSVPLWSRPCALLGVRPRPFSAEQSPGELVPLLPVWPLCISEGLAAYAPVKVAWLYSGLCTRTLVFGERAVWETYLGEARRFVRENRDALLRAVLKGWLGPRAVCGLVAKAWVPQAWLAARGVRSLCRM